MHLVLITKNTCPVHIDICSLISDLLLKLIFTSTGLLVISEVILAMSQLRYNQKKVQIKGKVAFSESLNIINHLNIKQEHRMRCQCSAVVAFRKF